MYRAWGTVWGTSCILQGTFPKGNGFPKTCLRLPSRRLRRQNHHPRVLPKAFQWKVVSMCKRSRSSGAGPRNFTPRRSRSRSPYISSPLNVSYAEFFRFMLQFLCLQVCVCGGSAVPQGGGGGGGPSLGNRPPGGSGGSPSLGGKDKGWGVHVFTAKIKIHSMEDSIMASSLQPTRRMRL